MATGNTESSGNEAQRRSEQGSRTGAKRFLSTVRERNSNGMVSMLAGAVLLVWSARTARRSKGRAALMGLGAAALLKHGLGKRGSSDGYPDDEWGQEVTEYESDRQDADKEVSDEAFAHRERSDVLEQSETNPRGTSGEPDVDTESDHDEGSIRFTEDQDGTPSPGLDEEDEGDPRIDDEAAEIDLSEASMADEASEAVGPSPEQAQPASTEGTEPEPTPEEDASHEQADVPDEDESDDDGTAGRG